MRATFAYTILRLLVFVAVAIALYFLGAHGFMLILLSLLISGIISFTLLSRHRDAMSASISGRITRVSEGLEAGTRAEDDN